jgi:hypothetical protein
MQLDWNIAQSILGPFGQIMVTLAFTIKRLSDQ